MYSYIPALRSPEWTITLITRQTKVIRYLTNDGFVFVLLQLCFVSVVLSQDLLLLWLQQLKHILLICCKLLRKLKVWLNFYFIKLIEELGNWCLKGRWRPKCIEGHDHGGNHGNPASANHQAPSHWKNQWTSYLPILTRNNDWEGGNGSEGSAKITESERIRYNCTWAKT